MKIVFAQGAFDDFDGTQEELDNLLSELKEMIESGSLMEKSEPVDLDLLQEENPEIYEKIMKFDSLDQDTFENTKNKLH
jgi:hypothetical protein